MDSSRLPWGEIIGETFAVLGVILTLQYLFYGEVTPSTALFVLVGSFFLITVSIEWYRSDAG